MWLSDPQQAIGKMLRLAATGPGSGGRCEGFQTAVAPGGIAHHVIFPNKDGMLRPAL